MTATNPGTTNLVSWWAMEENGGTAYDAHGTNHLTETSGTIPAAAGKVGYGRDFELGDTEFLEKTAAAGLTLYDEDFTVGFWFKHESITASTEQRYITKGSHNEWAVTMVYSTFRPALYVGGTGNANDYITLSNGIWYFYTGWYDSANNLIYNTVNYDAYSSTPLSKSGGVPGNTGTAFRLGASESASKYFDGILDEVFIYKRILSAGEREWLYNSGNGRTYSELFEEELHSINWW